MQLYHNSASPFVRKVRVVLAETGQEAELVDVFVTPLAPGDAVPAANPLGKIPALSRPDGPTLYDSRVICRYLDDRAGGGLYPEPPRLWETLTLEATADGVMDAAVLMVYEGRVRPDDLQFPTFVEAQWTKIARTLAAVEARWISHLSGPLDIAQIAMGCALGYLDFRHASRDWRAGHPGVAGWYDGFSSRASMQATRPDQ